MAVLRVAADVFAALMGGALCTFYWGTDDAGSWTPWWEVIVWLVLTFAGIPSGLMVRWPLSMLAAFAVPMLGMVPVAIVVHFLKKKHPDE